MANSKSFPIFKKTIGTVSTKKINLHISSNHKAYMKVEIKQLTMQILTPVYDVLINLPENQVKEDFLSSDVTDPNGISESSSTLVNKTPPHNSNHEKNNCKCILQKKTY